MTQGNIIERLRAPAFWCCESDEGHPGDATALVHEAAALIEEMREALDMSAGCIEGAVGVYDQAIPLETMEEFAGVPIAAIRRLVAVAKIARATLAKVEQHQQGGKK